MRKTFVEDLWGKNPKLIENQIKNICAIKEMYGDELCFDNMTNGVLKFEVHGRVLRNIQVGDFAIRTTFTDEDYENSQLSKQWRSFMFSQFGNPYAMQYISKRNQKLDRFMAEYEEKYNNQTRNVLKEMGFELVSNRTK